MILNLIKENVCAGYMCLNILHILEKIDILQKMCVIRFGLIFTDCRDDLETKQRKSFNPNKNFRIPTC